MRCDAFGSVWPRDRCVLGKESEVGRKRELEALAATQKEEVSWQKEGRVNGGWVECSQIFSLMFLIFIPVACDNSRKNPSIVKLAGSDYLRNMVQTSCLKTNETFLSG